MLLDQHEWKTKKTYNQVGKALDANLNRERINCFRQFLNDSKRQQIAMNSLCMSSRIPRIALTNKSAAFQSNSITRAAEKSRPYRPDIAASVDQRFEHTTNLENIMPQRIG